MAGKSSVLHCSPSCPRRRSQQGGGFGNAILGTLMMVGLATLIRVPIGILTAVFLAQAKDSKLAGAVRFAAKVLTGFPSILAGVFAYGAIVLATGGFSAVAGAIALSILMLPTIILTSESAIAMVPAKMKEASIGMGATAHRPSGWCCCPPRCREYLPASCWPWRVPPAKPRRCCSPPCSAITGWRTADVDLMQPTASLAVLIYNFSGMPFENQVEFAWAAALVLVVLVLIY